MASDDVTIAAQGKTRNLLYKRRDGKWTVETYWKTDRILALSRELPNRPFVMPCRALCGKDLKRPHLTCVTGCRIRRGWYGKLPETVELARVIQIAVLKHRRFARVKDAIMKWVLTGVENLLAN